MIWAILWLCILIRVESADVLGDLTPIYREFDTKQELAESNFWKGLMESGNLSPKHLTAIHIKSTNTILLLDENDALGVGMTLGKWFGNWRGNVYLTEVDLGSEKKLVGSDYFPIVTLSAEYTTNPVSIEREVNSGRSVNFSPQAGRAFHILDYVRTSLQPSQNSLVSQKELINCGANPGERVQLQVSNRMILYPRARYRRVRYKGKSSQFIDSEWKSVTSTMKTDRFAGALFYENSGLGKHRCVTNTAYFENPVKRKWVEYSIPFVS